MSSEKSQPSRTGPVGPALLIAVILLLMVGGQLMAKQGAGILSEGWEDLALAAPFLLVAYGALLIRGFLWIQVLRNVSLTLAYPIIAVAYVAIMAASYFVFDEQIGLGKMAGATLIVVGVILLGLSKRHQKGEAS